MKAHTIPGVLNGKTITKSEVKKLHSKPFCKRGTTAVCTGCVSRCLVSLCHDANMLPSTCIFEKEKDDITRCNWLEVVDDEEVISE